MNFITAYPDLVAGILGIIGSAILAAPLVTESADRKQWELFVAFKDQVLSRQDGSRASPAEIEAHRQIRERIIDYRLGQYQKLRLIVAVGLAFLIVAFVFLTIASIQRI